MLRWFPRLSAALVVSCLLSLPTKAADPAAGPLGTWSTVDDESRVLIEPCGEELCGRLIWLKEPVNAEGEAKIDRKNPDESLRSRPIVGLPLLAGFRPDPGNPGQWAGGTIYDPESGKTYSATMTPQPDGSLRVRGFVGMPMFGRTVVWTRAP